MRLIALAAATLAIGLGASSAAFAQSDSPNEKTTVTDIQYRISYSVEIPGNCAILGFSQWSAADFKGWEAYQVAVDVATTAAPRRTTFGVSAAPNYDDQLKYGGNIVSPPNGSHWVLIGDGSYRAGPPPADPDCTDMLARSQKVVVGNKVTTFFRRTSTCAAKFATLTRAQLGVKRAKGAKAKSRAKKTLSTATASFNRDCSK